MTVSNKTLGVAGLIGAPFLAVEMLSGDIVNSSGPQVTSPIGALADLVYMLGWMCSIYALYRSGAAGNRRWTNNVLKTQLVLLTIANLYNIWSATAIGTDTLLFKIADMIWPVSNAFMLVTGIALVRAGELKGWKRYSALIVGCWLPAAMLPMIIWGRVPLTLYFGLAYSVVAWGMMAMAAYQTRGRNLVYNHRGYPELITG